jgi:hypothetical protein
MHGATVKIKIRKFCVCMVLVGRPEGKRPLGRCRRRLGIIFKRIIKTWDGEA